MNTEQMRALADSHLDPGWTWRDAQLALREAADRIDALEADNRFLYECSAASLIRIDALEGALRDILAVRPLGDETSDLMIYSSLSAQKSAIARALLASESLNTGEPT